MVKRSLTDWKVLKNETEHSIVVYESNPRSKAFRRSSVVYNQVIRFINFSTIWVWGEAFSINNLPLRRERERERERCKFAFQFAKIKTLVLLNQSMVAQMVGAFFSMNNLIKHLYIYRQSSTFH